MTTLLKNAVTIGHGTCDLLIENETIRKIAPSLTEKADKTVDCKGKLLLPGLYNCHAHSAMTLFRGYSEDLPLDQWLGKIFPLEDALTDEVVYTSSLAACAEMIRNGVISFTDMYDHCRATAKAVADTGMKATITRGILCFDPSQDMTDYFRMKEAEILYFEWNNACGGRIKIDMSVHSEYLNTEHSCRYVADYAKKLGTGIHLHLSETEKEHKECMERHDGKTPTEFLNDCGVFDVPATAAHCVWVTDSDMDILREKGVTAAHNPSSNLKLGSGIMRTADLLDKGVSIALGTDGAASNNTLDIFKEMHLAALLEKGVTRQPGRHGAAEFLKMATVNGAKAQRRSDCGVIEENHKADLILVDTDEIHNIPSFDPVPTAVYSVRGSDVVMTMCDGKILYENGEFRTIDIEKLKYDMRQTCEKFYKKD